MFWVSSDFCTADYSFESKVSGSHSLLDHFVMSDTLFNQLYKADVLHSGKNVSDHSAISIHSDIPVEFVLSYVNPYNAIISGHGGRTS